MASSSSAAANYHHRHNNHRHNNHRPTSPTPSQLPPVPPSPGIYSNYAPSTAAHLSAYSLPLPPPPPPPRASPYPILTKADLEQSDACYTDLLAQAKTYRTALAALSEAASSFGSALESCARLKEARAELLVVPPTNNNTNTHHQSGGGSSSVHHGHGGGGGSAAVTNAYTPAHGPCTADTLLSAAGVHHLIANHQQILSETVYRSFEVPLLHDLLDAWRRGVEDEEAAYKREAAARGKEIRALEKEGVKMSKRRGVKNNVRSSRNNRGAAAAAAGAGGGAGGGGVAEFREHLVTLTGKLDGLTNLHAEHARTLLRESQEASLRIVEAGCSLVRAEVDIFEGLARKGWSGGGLDDLLEKGHDVFACDDDAVVAANGHGIVGPTAASGARGGAGAGGGVDSATGAKLFSILPPKSILSDAASDNGGLGSGGGAGAQQQQSVGSYPGRADSLIMDMSSHQYQSLTGAVTAAEQQQQQQQQQQQRQRGRARRAGRGHYTNNSNGGGAGAGLIYDDDDDNDQNDDEGRDADHDDGNDNDNDADSIFSDFNQAQASRGVRPFSPQPIRRRQTDVIMDPEELLSGSDGDYQTAREAVPAPSAGGGGGDGDGDGDAAVEVGGGSGGGGAGRRDDSVSPGDVRGRADGEAAAAAGQGEEEEENLKSSEKVEGIDEGRIQRPDDDGGNETITASGLEDPAAAGCSSSSNTEAAAAVEGKEGVEEGEEQGKKRSWWGS